ncbi:hypothetical protein DFJ67_1456 [Asanoa ferruginea]|uniref:Nucleotidyltransferase-like protein n=1 Tax=Asanoa ferruginea TaxID=53367 RepID=A0A3D9ZDL4_9ACTN|nr:hypothetical protein [Asanoa ferruginea]REF95498.1 hypothetical protein DFJ67_1456 [Asanoa ferruginea]GIF46766.1 hypothetical protein Afe04nite_13050 [Asanoa ferruginea]
MINFLHNPCFVALLKLGLPTEDFAIAGSGPLFARGWIEEISDVDVVARGAAWRQAAALGKIARAPFFPVNRVTIADGKVEVLDGWFPEIWAVDDLIDNADVFQGLRFVQLSVVLTTKRLLGRPRDKAHLRLIESHELS